MTMFAKSPPSVCHRKARVAQAVGGFQGCMARELCIEPRTGK